MEKVILSKLQSILPQILALSQTKRSICIDYDKEADVLYISFQKPQQATDTDIVSDDILIRKRKNEIVGITIMHASNFA